MRLDESNARCPICDPTTLESNVPGLYLAGVIVAGERTNEIFIENGRFHGDLIAADLATKLHHAKVTQPHRSHPHLRGRVICNLNPSRGARKTMDVLIQEKSFSFGVQYTINTPTSMMHANKKILSLLTHIDLFSASGSLLATISGESLFRSIYSVKLTDGKSYTYHCEKLWNAVFVCEGEGETYHLYTHKGLRYSIFKDDTQIASLQKEPVVIGDGNEYDLRLNPDANLVLLTSMVLALNSVNGRRSKGQHRHF